MRVLYYNWVDYLDPAGRGGGVSLYQRMLMQHMRSAAGIDVSFLCSGLAHRLRPAPPFWQPLDNGGDGKSPFRFTLVDSRPISPSHHSFGRVEQISHEPTEQAFAGFLEAEGPFDIVHFNNLEGLPARVLALKERFSPTRFVLSLHNYYPFCPQVNLWRREAEHCADFQQGQACVTCLPFRPDPEKVRLANAVSHTLDGIGLRPGVALYDKGVRPAMRGASAGFRRLASRRRGAAQSGTEENPAPRASGLSFAKRRADMVDLINRYCDHVVCVSERTAEIAEHFGVDRRIIVTMPIGTDHAERYKELTSSPNLPREDGTVTLAYLGYMRRDKGFFFLLDALEALPVDVKARIRLLIAASTRERGTEERLSKLGSAFASFNHVNGYDRDKMDALLSNVDLGVIPSLWEDNLPQVALEMHARRIPLLVSDRGGARELGRCPSMVFRAGDSADFAARIRSVLDGELDLERYWEGASVPASPEEHVRRMEEIYRGVKPARETVA